MQTDNIVVTGIFPEPQTLLLVAFVFPAVFLPRNLRRH